MGGTGDGVVADVGESGPVGFCEREARYGGILNVDLLVDLDENWEVVTVPVVVVDFPITLGGNVGACEGKIKVASASIVVESSSGSVVEDDHGLVRDLFNLLSSPIRFRGTPECIFSVEVAADDGYFVC